MVFILLSLSGSSLAILSLTSSGNIFESTVNTPSIRSLIAPSMRTSDARGCCAGGGNGRETSGISSRRRARLPGACCSSPWCASSSVSPSDFAAGGSTKTLGSMRGTIRKRRSSRNHFAENINARLAERLLGGSVAVAAVVKMSVACYRACGSIGTGLDR